MISLIFPAGSTSSQTEGAGTQNLFDFSRGEGFLMCRIIFAVYVSERLDSNRDAITRKPLIIESCALPIWRNVKLTYMYITYIINIKGDVI